MNEPGEDKIAAYYRLMPTEYPFLSSFTIRQAMGIRGVMEQSVTIVLNKSHDDDTRSLRVEFFGVRQLEIRQPELSQISLPHLEILSAIDLPQVQGRYLVRDPEQGRIVWFACSDFLAEGT